MVVDALPSRHAPARFFALPALHPDLFGDFPVLADLVAFVASVDLVPLQDTYNSKGSDAWPVDRLLVLALFHIHLGQPSPSDWHRQARCHVGLIRLLGNRVPARSTLYVFRDRLAAPLAQIHQTWLRQQRHTFPQRGEQIGIDGSFFALQASRHTLLSERGLHRRIHALDLPRLLHDLEPQLQPLAGPMLFMLLWLVLHLCCRRHAFTCPVRWPAWMAKTPRGRDRQRQRYQKTLDVLRDRPKSAYSPRKCRKNQKPRISPSAPHALLGRDKQHVYRPLVNAQIAVDRSSGLVTAMVLVPPVNDANQLLPLCEASGHACGVKPRCATVDTG